MRFRKLPGLPQTIIPMMRNKTTNRKEYSDQPLSPHIGARMRALVRMARINLNEGRTG